MLSLRFSRASLGFALLATLLLTTFTATAKTGAEFTGYYDYSGAVEQGDLVHLTLHVKIFNHGDTDLKGVIVTLHDSAPAMAFLGNFQPVKVWKKQQFIDITQDFSVSKLEFKQWKAAPAQPNLFILFQDPKGQSYQKSVQISRRPLLQ